MDDMNIGSKPRCVWCQSNPLLMNYHDEEWGVPEHDDRKLFELLVLGGSQAGLNWLTILKKRDHYRQAFDQFDPAKVARYDERKFAALINDPGIIRNRQKIAMAIHNAGRLLAVQEEFGSFNTYLWQFVGGKPKKNSWQSDGEIPPRSPESDALSADMIKRRFKFAGSTICYALMQSAGLVNDHVVSCFRYDEL